MSDSENEEIPALDVPEVEEEAPAAVEPPPKKACLTAEERKAKKKNANAKYYENVRQKLQEAEEKKEEEKAEKKPKAKRKPRREPSPEVVVRRRAPPKRARVRSPSPVSPRTVLRDAYLIMKSQERERKEEKFRSWFE